MNYIILDTEKTYNIGWLVVSSTDILRQREYIIKNNFEDRLVCGELNYRRKVEYFNTHPHPCRKTIDNPIEVIKTLNADIKKYNVQYIIGNQISEDRIQIGLLIKQIQSFAIVQENINTVKFFDLQKITKMVFPNSPTNLTALMNDILGDNFVQTHTALEDAKLCWDIFRHYSAYMPLFTVDDINLTSETTKQVFKYLSPIPISTKDMYSHFPSKSYTAKSLTTICQKMVTLGWATEKDYVQYSEKTGRELKTPIVKYTITTLGSKIQELYKSFIDQDLVSLLEIAARDNVIDNNKELTEFKNSLQAEYDKKYQHKKQELIKDYAARNKELTQKIAEYDKKCADLDDSYRKEVEHLKQISTSFWAKFKIKKLNPNAMQKYYK